MKTIFEEMGGTYRQVGDYFIPNITLPDDGEYQIGKHGRMRRSYLKEYRKILYNNYVLEGTLFKHLAEIDQTCNERIENIISAILFDSKRDIANLLHEEAETRSIREHLHQTQQRQKKAKHHEQER